MSNVDEIQFWNRRGGSQWREHQTHYDTLFSEITARLLAHARLQPGEKVVDVGCGNGDATLRVAEAVGIKGRVVALDVSVPLLDATRLRVEARGLSQVQLLEADAQTVSLNLQVDAFVSRFGVMFFDDPIAAFTNLRRHALPGGRLAFVAWGAAERNPWFAWPMRAAIEQLGDVPYRDPRKPGPTAFGDSTYLSSILSSAGWQGIEVKTEQLSLHVKGSAEDAARLASTLGPVSRVYREHPPTDVDREAIVRALTEDFKQGQHGNETLIAAEVHFATARTDNTAVLSRRD